MVEGCDEFEKKIAIKVDIKRLCVQEREQTPLCLLKCDIRIQDLVSELSCPMCQGSGTGISHIRESYDHTRLNVRSNMGARLPRRKFRPLSKYRLPAFGDFGRGAGVSKEILSSLHNTTTL